MRLIELAELDGVRTEKYRSPTKKYKVVFCTNLYILVVMRIAKALDLVAKCETDIRNLIELALAARQYEEIPVLANLAGAIADISGSVDAAPKIDESRQQESVASAPTAPASDAVPVASTRRVSRSNKYPRFERSGDRLVKVGWSKKDRAEYEHKVSYDAMTTVIGALALKFGKVDYLKMDDLIPIADASGQEVPSYQAYLVVAWLRELGLLERQGNDGYRLSTSNSTALDPQNLWLQTSEKR